MTRLGASQSRTGRPSAGASTGAMPSNPNANPVQRVLKSMPSVHLAVQRAMAATKELDERYEEVSRKVAKSCSEYLADTADSEPDPDRLRAVRGEQRAALTLAEKKVTVVSEAHDVVDRQIERLDAALELFQNEFGAGAGGPAPKNWAPPPAKPADNGGGGNSSGRRGGRAAATAAVAAASAAAGGSGGASSSADNGTGGSRVLGLSPEPEETFCSCGRISFGDMVCCDNPNCAIEWFHFGCVGLDASPPGTWLCPTCMLLQVSSVKALKRTAAKESLELEDASNGRGRGGPSSPGRGRGRGRGQGFRTDKLESPGKSPGRGGRGISKMIPSPGRGKPGKHPVKDCPACRGKHKAHTCGRGRNAELERLAAQGK